MKRSLRFGMQLTMLLVTTAVLLASSGGRPCQAISVTLLMEGDCGSPGPVILTTDDGCGLTVENAQAVGLPPNGRVRGDGIRDGKWDLTTHEAGSNKVLRSCEAQVSANDSTQLTLSCKDGSEQEAPVSCTSTLRNP